MTASLTFGLPPATLEKLNGVFAWHGLIERVILYGSRAKGTHHPGSDIDLTLQGPEIPFDEFLKIEDELDDLMLPYTVDLSQYRSLTNPDLVAHRDRVGVEIYSLRPRNLAP